MDQQHFNEALTTATLLVGSEDSPGGVRWQGTTASGELQVALVEGEEENAVVVADNDPTNNAAFCTIEHDTENSLTPGISSIDLAHLTAPQDKLNLRDSERTNTGDVTSTRLGTRTTLQQRHLARGERFIPLSLGSGDVYCLGNLMLNERPSEPQS